MINQLILKIIVRLIDNINMYFCYVWAISQILFHDIVLFKYHNGQYNSLV